MAGGLFDRFGGFANFMTQFNQFKQSMQNGRMDPKQQVQQMLNSGQMTQEQFNQLREMANQITGKNM